MAKYSIDTTQEDDKLIQAWCDAQPEKLDEKGNPIPRVTPEEVVNGALHIAILNCVDKCKFGVSRTVADEYNKTTDAKKAQVDAILGIKE